MSSKHEPVFFQTSTTVSALFRFMACVTKYWRDGARLKLPTARIELHSVCRIEPENLLELRASESLGFFFLPSRLFQDTYNQNPFFSLSAVTEKLYLRTHRCLFSLKRSLLCCKVTKLVIY